MQLLSRKNNVALRDKRHDSLYKNYKLRGEIQY